MTDFGPPYPKVNTAWKRNMSVKGNPVIVGDFALPEIEYLADLKWRWTEKIDGTNIRLYWDGETVTLGGRTDRAQIPANLADAIREMGLLDEEAWYKKWPLSGEQGHDFPETGVTLYGEGYGPGIQKGGGLYRDEPGFILFDVRVGKWWLQPEALENVAAGFGLETVPHAFDTSIWSAWSWVACQALDVEDELYGQHHLGYTSKWAERGVEPEGLVGTPLIPLYDRKGQRITVKLKLADARNRWDGDA